MSGHLRPSIWKQYLAIYTASYPSYFSWNSENEVRKKYHSSRQMSCRNVTCIELAQIVSGGTFVHVQNLSVTLRSTVSTNVSVEHPASYFRGNAAGSSDNFAPVSLGSSSSSSSLTSQVQPQACSNWACRKLRTSLQLQTFLLALATLYLKDFTLPWVTYSSAFPTSNAPLLTCCLLSDASRLIRNISWSCEWFFLLYLGRVPKASLVSYSGNDPAEAFLYCIKIIWEQTATCATYTIN